MNKFLRIVDGKLVVLPERDPARLYSPNSDGDHVELEAEAEAAQRAEWAANAAEKAKTNYIELRRAEYPPLPDQVDALLKGGPEADAMRAKVQAVKDKYPKPNGNGGSVGK